MELFLSSNFKNSYSRCAGTQIERIGATERPLKRHSRRLIITRRVFCSFSQERLKQLLKVLGEVQAWTVVLKSEVGSREAENYGRWELWKDEI